MLKDLNLEYVLFLDIETVPAVARFTDLTKKYRALWEKKAEQMKRNNPEKTADELYPRAGIYAEFGKVVCISCGFVKGKTFRLKSFFGDDEHEVLQQFSELLSGYYNTDSHLLCAHNGKEFDFPYLSRRMLVNGLKIPEILNLAGKKPWEVRHLDTMELWKFGDYKHYTSLDLLTTIFDIPTPKEDMDGSMVWKVYWEENDLERIARYCQEDVIATAQILRRYMGLPLFGEKEIILR